MKTSTHYRFTPIGKLSIRFYRNRNILRDTTPLIATRWQDVVRYVKGEGAMVESERSDDHSQKPGHGPHGTTRNATKGQQHRFGKHAHA